MKKLISIFILIGLFLMITGIAMPMIISSNQFPVWLIIIGILSIILIFIGILMKLKKIIMD